MRARGGTTKSTAQAVPKELEPFLQVLAEILAASVLRDIAAGKLKVEKKRPRYF